MDQITSTKKYLTKTQRLRDFVGSSDAGALPVWSPRRILATVNPLSPLPVQRVLRMERLTYTIQFVLTATSLQLQHCVPSLWLEVKSEGKEGVKYSASQTF